MNINGFNPDLAAQWKSQIGDVRAEDIKDVSFNAQTRSLTLSVNSGGEAREVSLAMPALDAPKAADESKIASMCAKLGAGNLMNLSPAQVETICKETTAEIKAVSDAVAAGGAPGVDTTGNSKSVLFDLYALMSLLVECGQKMRDAARDVRQAENEQVQASIQAQADKQYTAALTGLVASAVVCLVQVGLQAGNLARLSKGVDQQRVARNEAGVENAKSDLKMAELQAKESAAVKNYDSVAKKTSDAVKTKVEGRFNQFKEIKTDLENDFKAEQRLAENKLELGKLEEIQNGNLEKGVQPKELTQEQQTRKTELETKIAQDKEVIKGHDDRLARYRTGLKSELATIRDDPKATPAEKQYAEAYVTKEIAQNSTGEQLSADYMAAQGAFNQKSAMLQHSTVYLDGVQLESSSRIYGDMIMAVGNVAQGIISNIAEMKRAQATEMGAEQQVSQEMLDQAKDLFAQCQSLIDSVIQLMQAVLQAEVQSMRDAIQA